MKFVLRAKSEDRKEIIRGTSVALVFRVVGMLSGYIFFFLVSRIYGAESLGIWALSFTVLSLAAFSSRLGLPRALLRFISAYASQGAFSTAWLIYKKSLKIILSLSILIGIGIFSFSGQISLIIFNKPELTPALKLVGIILPFFVTLSINTECIRGVRRIEVYGLVRSLSNYLVPILVIGLFYFFYTSLYIPVIATVIGLAVAFVVSTFYWVGYGKSRLTDEPSYVSYKKIIYTALPMLLSGSMFILVGWINTFMIGIYNPAEDVGFYNVAAKIANLGAIPTLAITTIAAPKFAQYFGKGDLQKLRENIDYVGKLIFYFSTPILLIVILFPDLLLGFFGKDFAMARNALLIIAGSRFLGAICGPVGFIMQMTGKEKEYSWVRLAEVVAIIAINIWLIPILGYTGAAIASLVGGMIRSFSSIFLINKYIGINTLIFFRLRKGNF